MNRCCDLLQWFDAQGAWAPLLFILIMAAVVVLVLPGVLFTTGAGFVFGVVEGTMYVVIGHDARRGAGLPHRALPVRATRPTFIMARSRLRW
jgi:hypothetical protein